MGIGNFCKEENDYEIEAKKRHHLQWIEGYNDNNNNKDNIIGDELLLNFGAKFQR